MTDTGINPSASSLHTYIRPSTRVLWNNSVQMKWKDLKLERTDDTMTKFTWICRVNMISASGLSAREYHFAFRLCRHFTLIISMSPTAHAMLAFNNTMRMANAFGKNIYFLCAQYACRRSWVSWAESWRILQFVHRNFFCAIFRLRRHNFNSAFSEANPFHSITLNSSLNCYNNNNKFTIALWLAAVSQLMLRGISIEQQTTPNPILSLRIFNPIQFRFSYEIIDVQRHG